MTTAERFFYKHAGYSYDPKSETKAQGRRRCARLLADAETWAADAGLTFTWEWDETPWDGDGPAPSEVLGCIARWPDGRHAASLWGIADPSRAYARVIEAELACEARGALIDSTDYARR